MKNLKNIIFLMIGFFISLIISVFISLFFNIKDYNINNLILLLINATVGLYISGKLIFMNCKDKCIKNCESCFYWNCMNKYENKEDINN